MKALIIDDERLARVELRRLLSPFKEINIVGEAINADDAVAKINELNPDLIFLDIQMPGKNGFELLEELDSVPIVIFTTAYDEYALKAFEVNSIDYLLKPISIKNFERAIAKLRSLATPKESNTNLIANLLASFKQTKEVYKSNFLIPHKDKFIPLSVDRIACFYTENKTVKIITEDNETYNMDSSLEDLTNHLNPTQFFRANRQYIVSHKAIKDISIWFGSKLSINLEVPVPEKIIVSKARVPEFKAWYTA